MLRKFMRKAFPILSIALLLLVPVIARAQQTDNASWLTVKPATGDIDPLAYTTASKEAGGLFKGVTVACWHRGTCDLCDGMVVFINVADAILKLLAIVAVVFFIYGSGLLMMSNGNDDMVSRGKGTLKATVVGTIIVLFAWQAMSLIVLVIANRDVNFAENTSNALPGFMSWYNVADSCHKNTKS